MKHIFIPMFGAATQCAGAVVLSFIGDDLLVTSDENLPEAPMLESLGVPEHRLMIGKVGDVVYELHVWPAQTAIPVDLSKAEHRALLDLWPQPQAVSRAKQLASWLHENRYCGSCGNALETAMLTPSRICNKCGFVAYPRISPVCIVLISRGDEILLARSPHFSPGMYSALAGFVEAGESLEAGVHREVREEVGIEICNLLWFGSQSWPFPHSLMLGFMADYAGGTLLLQEEEIEDAQWFRRDHLPALPHPSTIAYRMIRTWLDQG